MARLETIIDGSAEGLETAATRAMGIIEQLQAASDKLKIDLVRAETVSDLNSVGAALTAVTGSINQYVSAALKGNTVWQDQQATKVLDTLSGKLNAARGNAELFGQSLQTDKAEIRAYQQALDALLKLGLTPVDTRVKALAESLRALGAAPATQSIKALYSEFQKTGQLIPDLQTKIKNLKTAMSMATTERDIAKYNVRLRDAQAELKRLQSLGVSATQAQVSGFTRAAGAARTFTGELRLQRSQLSGVRGAFGSFTGQLQSLVGMYVSLTGAINGVRAAFSSSLRTDALATSFGFILDDSEERLEKLRAQADLLGLQYVTLAETNKQFIAAAKASNFELSKAERIFDAVASVGAKLKLRNDQIAGTFLALEQMISKGNVTMEELRRQLGDRIPGAFAIFAQSMGVSEKELNKLLKAGDVLATDTLPAFAEQLSKAFGGDVTDNIVSLQASVNRLTNTFDTAVQDSGINKFFSAIVDGANAALRSITGLFKAFKTDELPDEDRIAELSLQYGLLASKGLDPATGAIKRTAEEGAKLQQVMNELGELLPGAVEAWDAYGNAVAINQSKVSNLVAANQRLAREADADKLGKLNKAYDAAAEHAQLYQNTLNRMLENGGWSAKSLKQVESDFARMRAEATRTAAAIQNAFGYEALTGDQRGLLQRAGLDAAGAAMRDWDAARKKAATAETKRTKETTETELAEIEKRRKAAERLALTLIENENRVQLQIREGRDKEVEQVRQRYEKLFEMHKGNAAALIQLENDQALELEALHTKHDEKELAARKKAADKYVEIHRKMWEGIIEEVQKQGQDSISIELTYARRLNERRSQLMLRQINTEYKARAEATERRLKQEIAEGGDILDIQRRAGEAQLKLQREIWAKMEEVQRFKEMEDLAIAFGDAVGNAFEGMLSDGKNIFKAIGDEFKRLIVRMIAQQAAMKAANLFGQLFGVGKVGSQNSSGATLDSFINGIAAIFGGSGNGGKWLSNLGSTFKSGGQGGQWLNNLNRVFTSNTGGGGFLKSLGSIFSAFSRTGGSGGWFGKLLGGVFGLFGGSGYRSGNFPTGNYGGGNFPTTAPIGGNANFVPGQSAQATNGNAPITLALRGTELRTLNNRTDRLNARFNGGQ